MISAHFSTLQILLFKQPSYLSDHSAIVAWLNLNTRLIGDETHTPNGRNRLSKLPRQFCWEVDSHLKFKNALRTEPIQILIRQYMERNTEDVNISLENAMTILTETSKLCLKIKAKKTYKRIKKSSNKKWFDCECRLKRHELRKVSNETHRDPLNSELRKRYHNIYKKLLDTKKRGFHKEKTIKLDELALNPDKASFWNCLNSMSDNFDMSRIDLVSKNLLANVFRNCRKRNNLEKKMSENQ